MKRLSRNVRWGAGAFLFAGMLFVAGRSSGQEGPPPTIVIFLADDHGQLDSTVYGATDVSTPRMQQLAAAGLVFDNAYVASPACAPSRAALLSGLVPPRNGAEANHTYKHDFIKPLPDYLHALGYEVAAFGKVAHGADRDHNNFDHVDRAYDLNTVASYLDGRDASKPLCLFVGTTSPHVAWKKSDRYDPNELVLPPKFIDTPETRIYRADYYTEVTEADTEMGEIYDLARERFDAANTLFIYTSDHGGQWPFGKWNLYETGLKSPFIAAWPGKIEAGRRTDAFISWIDLLPTLVEIGGGEPPQSIDGRSFAAVLFGESDTHREEIYGTHTGDREFNVYPIRSVRAGDWKYILNLYPDSMHTTHIDRAKERVTSGYFYWKGWDEAARTDREAAEIVSSYRRRPPEELFDLSEDPNEENNLAKAPEHQDRITELRAKVEAWMAKYGDKRLLSDALHPLAPQE